MSNGDKSVVLIYFSIIVILIASLNSFGIIDSNSIGKYLFPQGDIDFYIVNLENGKKEKYFSIKEQFITGSTYFVDDQNQYLGYIQAVETNIGEYFSSFKVVNLSSMSSYYEVNLPFFEHKINGTVIYDGLTVHYLNNQPVFSTILQAGTTESNTKTSMIQFSLNGSIITTIEYNITDYPFAKLHDISSIDQNKYLVLTSLKKSDILDLEASYILTFDFNGNVTNILNIENSARSLAYDPSTNSIFTSTRDSKFINQLNSKGELVRSVNVNIESSEIDLINSTHLIAREYQENRQNLYYSIGIAIVVFLLIPITIQNSNKIYSFFQQNKKN